MTKPNKIRCPKCGNDKKLAVYIEGRALLKLPVIENLMSPSYSLCLKPKLDGMEVTVYESENGETRFVLYEDDVILQIDCGSCGKIMDLQRPEECDEEM